MNLDKSTDIVRLTPEGKEKRQDTVVREIPLTIFVNNNELVTLQCSPDKLEYLAIGFLLSGGFIKGETRIKHIDLNKRGWYVRISLEGDLSILEDRSFKRIITSGCAGAVTFYRDADIQDFIPIKSRIRYPHEKIFNLMKKMHQRSLTFKNTGGVHCCALSNLEDIEIFAEDIGRHNAVDKVLGECFLRKIPTQDKIILTSGRVSLEILIKMVKGKVPVVVSHSAPTDLAIDLAKKMNVTLIGFVRGHRMNIYTHDYRIT